MRLELNKVFLFVVLCASTTVLRAQGLPPLSAPIGFQEEHTVRKDSLLNVAVPLRKIKTTAFFCVIEEKIERKTIPLRMRLGSLDYVNKLENKSNTGDWPKNKANP